MINIKKIGVIFGGKSTEHKISVVSGTSIIANLDKTKYDIYPIYIDENGLFYEYTKNIFNIKPLTINDKVFEIEHIENVVEYLKKLDVIFPVLHGLNGEDGTIQGMLEIIGIPYVGCSVLSSSLCMDKVYTKTIIQNTNIEQAKYMYIKKYKENFLYIDKRFNEHLLSETELIDRVTKYLKFPIFIKPSNSGSSVGIHKSLSKDDFIKKLNDAFKYDRKVLLEENIKGREVECAVLGTDDIITSNVGEILASGDFYSFDSKYKNKETVTVIPANIEESIVESIKKLAKKAYKACDCSGLARVDFFIENGTNRIIFNEINTMPGFTEISMYPKLMEDIGLSYKELLDRLIELAK